MTKYEHDRAQQQIDRNPSFFSGLREAMGEAASRLPSDLPLEVIPYLIDYPMCRDLRDGSKLKDDTTYWRRFSSVTTFLEASRAYEESLPDWKQRAYHAAFTETLPLIAAGLNLGNGPKLGFLRSMNLTAAEASFSRANAARNGSNVPSNKAAVRIAILKTLFR